MGQLQNLTEPRSDDLSHLRQFPIAYQSATPPVCGTSRIRQSLSVLKVAVKRALLARLKVEEDALLTEVALHERSETEFKAVDHWLKQCATPQGVAKEEAIEETLDRLKLHKQAFPKEGQLLETLFSGKPRNAFSDDKEPGAVQVCLLPGVFNSQKLIPHAPSGYDTPPRPKRFGTNVFYYYGPGGGGVAYPDMYYFNLDGRALRIVFDGPYSGDSKSPSEETQAIEKLMLSSFLASSR